MAVYYSEVSLNFLADRFQDIRRTPMFMTMSEERIHVITSVERRRRFTVEQKMRLVEESNRPGMSVSHVARTHGGSTEPAFPLEAPDGTR
jgi:hypothetical protein